VGVWQNGGKYCFGCGWRMKGNTTIEQMKAKLINPEPIERSPGVIDSSHFTYLIPTKALVWLRKYGINDEEIRVAKICWNNNTDSLVFPIYIGSELRVTNERYFGDNPNHPKYITNGKKNNSRIVITPQEPRDSTTVICVEDFVSALKVGRQYCCVPLLGATIDLRTIISLSTRFKNLRVWLDSDKASQSVLEASRASQYFSGVCRSVITELDPKEYDDGTIQHLVS
jgi:hypothetical protein